MKRCKLTTLETRRSRGDMIEVFKILKGFENIDSGHFFSKLQGTRTRGHSETLQKPQCRLDIRKFSFSHRVINDWNKLPTECVRAESINAFKNKIDKYFLTAGYV